MIESIEIEAFRLSLARKHTRGEGESKMQCSVFNADQVCGLFVS